MISENLVFVQLAQLDDYVCIVELANSLEASVSEVRQRLKELGDRVENDGKDRWRVVKKIATDNQLTEEEKIERDALESTVQQAFFLAGQALKQLRDKRLYRSTHNSFKSYVRDRFDFTRRAADYLIASAEVMKNLKREQFVLGTNVLPTRESHCRPLAKLSAQEQTRAWDRAVEKAGGKIPSLKLIKAAVVEIKSVDDAREIYEKVEPSFREVNYTAGMGLEYTVKLDEETYKRLQRYQDKIGSATKSGAIARLLDGVVE